jgi:hypothetical protein
MNNQKLIVLLGLAVVATAWPAPSALPGFYLSSSVVLPLLLFAMLSRTAAGTGVETAKNLILSNVGSVMVWDPAPAVSLAQLLQSALTCLPPPDFRTLNPS